MSSLFDFESKPDAYAVMGNPIAHSKSPQIHQMFAQQTQQHITYEAILVDVGGFEQAVGNFVATGGKGLNITVPFKRDAWKLVTQRSQRAELAGAVNTIIVNSDHSLRGDNTDGAGLVRDLAHNHALTLQAKNILILGAGGAARGVLEPICNENPALVLIANRTPDRAHELAHQLSQLGNIKGCGFSALLQQKKSFDIIINATSASLQGEVPDIPAHIISAQSVCYDMMYGAQATAFMRWAEQHGAARSMDGLGMLVEQAAESFYLWRGVRPQTKDVISAIRQSLG
ncbi:MAG: shikimate dehydrogenase [Gammaproteobacteria bacterium SG8_11]|nr:MAG: shikimate dehydrogenase [Gammaproteobacteria bacterium SG8_11]